MSRVTSLPRLPRLWLFAFGIATPLGILSAGGSVLAQLSLGRAALRGAYLGILDWYLWALLAPAVILFSERIWISPTHRVRPILGHLAFGSLIAVSQLGLFHLINRVLIVGIAPDWNVFLVLAGRWFPIAFLVYWALVIGTHAAGYASKHKERELQATQFREQLTSARLDNLRAQLRPHFLFNALNTVSVLIREKRGQEAVDTIAGLSDLLRRAVRASDQQEVSLSEEIEFAVAYLDIQKKRFGEKLQVQVDVGPEASAATVPSLILQPLVENAIRHGVERESSAGTVGLRAERIENDLVIEVWNSGSGPGTPAAVATSTAGDGVGLANTRARLEALYGDKGEVTLSRNVGNRTAATLRVPWKQAEGTG
ncbi:MAG: histidine kinase [Gemmatimonadota bacterium]